MADKDHIPSMPTEQLEKGWNAVMQHVAPGAREDTKHAVDAILHGDPKGASVGALMAVANTLKDPKIHQELVGELGAEAVMHMQNSVTEQIKGHVAHAGQEGARAGAAVFNKEAGALDIQRHQALQHHDYNKVSTLLGAEAMSEFVRTAAKVSDWGIGKIADKINHDMHPPEPTSQPRFELPTSPNIPKVVMAGKNSGGREGHS